MTYKEEFITFMVRSGVLTFGDFTTKSGRKTPYFINTGNYKTGCAGLHSWGDYYAACMQEHMGRRGGPPCSAPPTRASRWSVACLLVPVRAITDRDMPYCFNRKEAKDHGEGGSMVGYKPQDGDRGRHCGGRGHRRHRRAGEHCRSSSTSPM